MKETKINNRWKSAVNDAIITRIENTVSTGMFDCNVAKDGVEWWVELKVFKSGKIFIRGRQMAWATRRMKMDMPPMFVLAADEDDLYLWRFDDIEIFLRNNPPVIDKRGHIVIDSKELPPWQKWEFKAESFRQLTKHMYGDVRMCYNHF